MSTTDPADGTQPDSSPPAATERAEQSRAARTAWMVSGLAFFIVGVILTLTDPDNVVFGVTFLALGVVFYSLSGMTRSGRQRP